MANFNGSKAWGPATIVIASLLLSACGGGGGSGGGSGDPTQINVTDDRYSFEAGQRLDIVRPGVLGNDTAPAGRSLSAALVRGASHGALDLRADGSFSYVPDASGAADQFVYRASDGTGQAKDGTVTLNPNQAPAARNACVPVTVNASTSGALPGTDPDGQPLAYEILDRPAKGSLSSDVAGNYTYTPRADVRGLDRFTYRATDSLGRISNTGTVNLLLDGAVRIMPLGDSITEGLVDGNANWPPAGERVGYRRKLYADLEALSSAYRVDFVGSQSNGTAASPPIGDPNHEGHPGYCDGPSNCSNGNVAQAVTQWLDASPPDIILLHIGTNDFDTSAADVSTIIDNIQSWEQSHWPVELFIARIIETANGTLAVDTFNNNVEAMVNGRNDGRLWMVDQQRGAGLVYQVGVDMGDNLHPSQSGYDKMANRWRDDLVNAGVLPTCN